MILPRPIRSSRLFTVRGRSVSHLPGQRCAGVVPRAGARGQRSQLSDHHRRRVGPACSHGPGTVGKACQGGFGKNYRRPTKEWEWLERLSRIAILPLHHLTTTNRLLLPSRWRHYPAKRTHPGLYTLPTISFPSLHADLVVPEPNIKFAVNATRMLY